jgi:glucokinase
MPKQRLINTGTMLAGDVGGTKTILALFDVVADNRTVSELRTFKNDDFANFDDLLSEYIAEIGRRPQALSLGVAGPVNNERVQITNRPWSIDKEKLKNKFGVAEVFLLNDLEATAHAIQLLKPEELHSLHEGQPIHNGNIAVIAPGTGLGEAFLTNNNGEYVAHASEGGHSDFAPRTKLQDDLLVYLREKFDHVSYERICSGSGLPNIYNFLRDNGLADEPAWLMHLFEEAKDPTALIVEAALDQERESAICQMTVSIFVEVLAAEAGNLALKVGASAGVFLGGGIAPRILALLKIGDFPSHFSAKGRYRNYLERIPIQVMLNTQTALIGGADYGLRQLQSN